MTELEKFDALLKKTLSISKEELPSHVVPPASGADDFSIRPALRRYIRDAVLRIGVVEDGVL